MSTTTDSVPGKTIQSLVFSDLYLEPGDKAWYKRSRGDRERNSLPAEMLAEVRAMREQLQAHKTGLDFRTTWDDVAFRVTRLETMQGDVYVCRRIHDEPIPFELIGYPEKLREGMLTESFVRGGLVLFTGSMGDGKSMSQASWIIRRLEYFGGTACTVENPIEIALQGEYPGKNNTVGTLYQNEVRNDTEFEAVMTRLMRAAPDIIMLGEIRMREAARAAVMAGSISLVSSTMHAIDPLMALERLRNMIHEAGLDVSLLADSLCAVFHQKMTINTFGGREQRFINVSPLIVSGATNETAIRAHLRSGDFSLLSTEIQRQKDVAAGKGTGRF